MIDDKLHLRRQPPVVSRVYDDGPDRMLRVSPTHSINVQWLREHADDLYAAWKSACIGVDRDRIARQIERRLNALELVAATESAELTGYPPTPSSTGLSTTPQARAHPSTPALPVTTTPTHIG